MRVKEQKPFSAINPGAIRPMIALNTVLAEVIVVEGVAESHGVKALSKFPSSSWVLALSAVTDACQTSKILI